MHLSPLSEGLLSDHPPSRHEKPHDIFHHAPPTTGRDHRDGLLRGLALLVVFGVLMSIALISSALHAADAKSASFSDDDVVHCAVR